MTDGAGRQIGRDLRWGLGWGVWMAAGYSVLAVLLAAVRGSGDYPELGLSTPRIVGLYWLVGPTAGLVAGVLRPLTRYAVGAILTGWAVGAVIFGGVGLALRGPTREAAGLAFAAGLLGAFWAMRWWERTYDS